MVLRGLVLTLFLATVFGLPAGLLALAGLTLIAGGLSGTFATPVATTAGMVLFGLILTTVSGAMLAGIAVYVWSQWREHDW